MVHELVRYMKSVNMHGEKIKDYPFFKKIRSDSRTRNASYSVDSNVIFYLRIEQLELQFEHPPPSHAAVKNG